MSQKDTDGQTPMMLAAESKKWDIVEAILVASPKDEWIIRLSAAVAGKVKVDKNFENTFKEAFDGAFIERYKAQVKQEWFSFFKKPFSRMQKELKNGMVDYRKVFQHAIENPDSRTATVLKTMDMDMAGIFTKDKDIGQLSMQLQK